MAKERPNAGGGRFGASLDPDTAAELRQLRALAQWQAQELAIFKKAIVLVSVIPTP
ncbi:hypothetical protein GCM10011495_35670 [Hymenobacter frigidus]|uniref:Uncharacterized protein n=1 Tax=Hymenobacter frigidus TaxID=1524095 RepID=A0ABQ2AGN3_9BACT|nr:hypothetical protein GCM10011495_35670 [Hymenobacter frigidus]